MQVFEDRNKAVSRQGHYTVDIYGILSGVKQFFHSKILHALTACYHVLGKMKKWIEIAAILSVVTLASMSILILLYRRRNRRGIGGQVDPEATTKSKDAQRTTPLKQLFHKKDFEGQLSERKLGNFS